MERFIIKYDPTLSSDPYQSQEYAIMEEESHGEHVKYEDYQLLEAKIVELEKENIELEECFDECYAELGKVQHKLDKQVRSSGDRIAELENQWIRVENRLPEFFRYVLVYHPAMRCTLLGSFIKSSHKFRDVAGDSFYKDDVTHWMPLPEPPKEQGE